MARTRVKGGMPRQGTPAYERMISDLEREARTDAEFMRRKALQARSKRRLLARTDVNEFCIQVGRDGETGARIVQTELHERFQMIADMYPRAIVMAFPESGKCLAPATRVLLSDGSTARADSIEIGDVLMGPDSSPRRVLSTTRGRGPMYRIVPRKGDPWECNDVHVLTLVNNRTDEIIDIPLNEYLGMSDAWKHQHKLFQAGLVAFAGALDIGDLPVDPYFLGVWLGDGTKSLKSLVVSKNDDEIRRACESVARDWGLECVVSERPCKCRQYRIGSRYPGDPNRLLRLMRSLMFGSAHVPDMYRRASIAARRQLLAGIIDTDGHASGKCVEIVQRNVRIASGVAFVARSLGIRVTRKVRVVSGREYVRLLLSGAALHDVPTRIARKTTPKRTGGKNSLRVGFDVVPLGDGDYAGFTLDGDGRFLLGDFTVTHNTSQLSILRLLYMIGRNPNIHIALVSKTGGTSSKSARAIKEYIERNEDLHEIFPELIQGNKWEDSFFTVKRSSFSKDPTVQALGLGGTLIGSRVDVLVFDDILDDENTRTPAERKKVYRRVKAFMDRLSATGVVLFLTNAWHPDDAMHKLEREGTPSFRFPVVDDDGVSNWPLKWTPERLEQVRQDLGPLEFARAFLCKARDEGESPFDEQAVESAFAAGSELRQVSSLLTHELPPGAWIYTGVDLAVTKGTGSHNTAFSTILLWPESDGTMSRQLLWAESGKWSSREIRDRFIDHHKRYMPTFIVENNAAQRWIIDIVQNQADLDASERQALEIVPFTTGKNKAHAVFGVEGLAVEMSAGLWVFPIDGPVRQFVEDLKTEMLYYSRGGHTGDLLMATWFAREGARRGARAGAREPADEQNELSPQTHTERPQNGSQGPQAGVVLFE